MFMQMVLALHEIHRHKKGKILHRGVRPENILMDQQGNLKLGDFSLAKMLNKDNSFAATSIGDSCYVSPEQLSSAKSSEKSDIWSLGCLLFEMAALVPPFQAQNHLAIAMKIKKGVIPSLPSCYSSELHRVVRYAL